MRKLLLHLLLAVIASVTVISSFTSCLSGDTSENTYTTYDYFTITGNATQGYTLYSDNNTIIIPDLQSITTPLGADGFGSHHRAMLSFSYKQNQISADGNQLNGATLTGYTYFIESDPLTLAEADSLGVTSADSIVSLTDLGEPWVIRGYFNVSVLGYYGSQIVPSLRLVYDPATIQENTIAVSLYYNPRATTLSYSGTLYYAYPFSQLAALVPGNDVINVIVQTPGHEDQTIKAARN